MVLWTDLFCRTVCLFGQLGKVLALVLPMLFGSCDCQLVKTAPPAVHGGKNHPTQFSTQILLKKAGERAGF
jgi:hypothetical protein